MSEQSEVKLQELTGVHVLTGVGYTGKYGATWDSYAAGWFVLDGKKYIAYENPSDGYRSCMDHLEVTTATAKDNLFPGVEVLCRMCTENVADWYNCDILEILDVKNGEKILSVGTANKDDYYPWFVFVYIPENMACNADKSLREMT